MFTGCTVLPDSKETELGSSDQEDSPSADKKYRGIRIVWPYSNSGGMDISEVPECHLL